MQEEAKRIAKGRRQQLRKLVESLGLLVRLGWKRLGSVTLLLQHSLSGGFFLAGPNGCVGCGALRVMAQTPRGGLYELPCQGRLEVCAIYFECLASQGDQVWVVKDGN